MNDLLQRLQQSCYQILEHYFDHSDLQIHVVSICKALLIARLRWKILITCRLLVCLSVSVSHFQLPLQNNGPISSFNDTWHKEERNGNNTCQLLEMILLKNKWAKCSHVQRTTGPIYTKHKTSFNEGDSSWSNDGRGPLPREDNREIVKMHCQPFENFLWKYLAISKRRIKHSLVREFSSNEWSHHSWKGHNSKGINIYEYPPEPLSHFHPNKLSKGEGGFEF